MKESKFQTINDIIFLFAMGILMLFPIIMIVVTFIRMLSTEAK